ncbi:MAG: hypothetical protein KGK30_04975, partial [Elusimicrobia bacterium]|nr:hypothetical protein [Elusimicrobiota bacterium]
MKIRTVKRKNNPRLPLFPILAALAFLLLAPAVSHASTINMPTNFLFQNTGLVGWWTFDGKDTNWATGVTNDKSGGGNNGQLVSMSTTTSPVIGKVGQALKFNGAGQQVTINNNSSLNPSSISISFWAKYPSSNTTYRTIDK